MPVSIRTSPTSEGDSQLAPLASGGDLAWALNPIPRKPITEEPQPWNTRPVELSSSLLKWVLICPNHLRTFGKVEDRIEPWLYLVNGKR